MQVLWWLVFPALCTLVAMGWAAWAGRERAAVRRDDSEVAMRRIEQALAKPTPVTRSTTAASGGRSGSARSRPTGPSHSVIVRPVTQPSSRS